MSRTPYYLPEEDCERLRRTEMNGLRLLLAHLSTAAYVQDDLTERLKCIPDGNRRLKMAVGGLRAVCDDVIGTITKAQARQIYGTMKDYELRLVPKLTPSSVNIILTKEQGMDLMDIAKEKCPGCVETSETCRGCRLYKIFEATTPLDDYGDGLICPYSLAEWEE